MVAARILVAFEDEYLAYREVIAAAIRVLRPGAQVHSANLDALAQAVERLDPHVVICSWPNTVDPGRRPAWVVLPTDPIQPARICVGGRYSERANPTVEVLLEIIDEVEKQLTEAGSGDLPLGC